MSDTNRTMTRYLLGELPEAERTALERACFDDPRAFAALAEFESALIDDHVRGKLAPELSRRLDQVYRADPPRWERVAFARTLIDRLDAAGQPVAAGAHRSPGLRDRRGEWFRGLFGRRPALQWSLALLVMAVVSGALWFGLESRRSRPQVAAGPTPAGGPAAPLDRAPTLVVLALVVGPGERGADTGAPVTLVVPGGTTEVRLALSLRDHDSARYRVILRQVGGAEILRSADLTPESDGSGAALTIDLPADHVPAGDYLLTLQGASEGDFEDLSQSLFRVTRQ